LFKSKNADLNFLDRILTILLENINHTLSFAELVDKLNLDVTEVKVSDETTLNFVNIGKKDWEQYYYFAAALDYLLEEKLVHKLIDNGFRISFLGIVRLKTYSFVRKGFVEKWGNNREFALLLIALVSSISSVLIAIFS